MYKYSKIFDFNFNMDDKRRREILEIGQENWFSGGITSFSGADVEQIKLLFDEHFINPNDRQNAAPSAQEFYEFMQKYPEFKAHGYVVSRNREDYRVTIEGLEGTAESPEAFQEFIDLCRNADSFDVRTTDMYCYSWWD